jgi:hypothetical protein
MWGRHSCRQPVFRPASIPSGKKPAKAGSPPLVAAPPYPVDARIRCLTRLSLFGPVGLPPGCVVGSDPAEQLFERSDAGRTRIAPGLIHGLTGRRDAEQIERKLDLAAGGRGTIARRVAIGCRAIGCRIWRSTWCRACHSRESARTPDSGRGSEVAEVPPGPLAEVAWFSSVSK